MLVEFAIGYKTNTEKNTTCLFKLLPPSANIVQGFLNIQITRCTARPHEKFWRASLI